MTIFEPTYLYIKQHSITGKLYFGKTIKNPEIYLGSGKRWRYHIKKHGEDHVNNLWYCIFYDKEHIIEFALNFSEQQNIVESDEWLNLIPENGIDGVIPGSKMSEATRKKMSLARTGHKTSDETKEKIRSSQIGIPKKNKVWNKGIKVGSPRKYTDKRLKENIEIGRRKSTKGLKIKKHAREECPHCKGIFGIGILKRHHLNAKCKVINITYNN